MLLPYEINFFLKEKREEKGEKEKKRKKEKRGKKEKKRITTEANEMKRIENK